MSNYLKQHSRNVMYYSLQIGKRINLNASELILLSKSANLHDIGKTKISNSILLKDKPLTEEEWNVIKNHPLYGSELLKDKGILEKMIIEGVLYHHERWDGQGYPKGLKGSNIPLFARIISIGDVYDAITSDRPYSKARSHYEALSELKSNCNTQFDANLVRIFIKSFESNYSYSLCK